MLNTAADRLVNWRAQCMVFSKAYSSTRLFNFSHRPFCKEKIIKNKKQQDVEERNKATGGIHGPCERPLMPMPLLPWFDSGKQLSAGRHGSPVLFRLADWVAHAEPAVLQTISAINCYLTVETAFLAVVAHQKTKSASSTEKVFSFCWYTELWVNQPSNHPSFLIHPISSFPAARHNIF